MDNFQLHIKNDPRIAAQSDGGFWGMVKKTALVERLYNRTGVIILSLLAIGVAVGGVILGPLFAFGIIAAMVGIPGIIAVVMYAEFGMVIVLIFAFNMFLLMRLGVEGPIGIAMDGLQGLMMLGLVIRARNEQNWRLLKSPVSIAVLLWIGYNFFEVLNPAAESKQAWMYTIRSVAIVQMLYFVFIYNIRTVETIRLLIKLWLVLALFAALYAYKQEYIGFSGAEEAYLHSDPAIADLLFIAGHWRKFSIFSDPVTFAYNMAIASILCISIIAGKFQLWKKVVLGLLMCLYLQSMLFSGTRGANVLLPAALFLFAIMNYNRKVLVFSIFAALFLVFLINVPTSDPNIVRFQTAFKPNEDASYKLRKYNQKRIQPYIQSHPIGGGLGATGTWGKRFAPNSYLAKFPPDSGYIRIAVELGPIGLLFFCTLIFTILKTGINNFYKIRNPELKTYCLAMTLVIFAFNLANFPQEALVQFPSNVLFSLSAAILTVTYRIDQKMPRYNLPEVNKKEEVISY